MPQTQRALIRRATAADCPRMMELIQELAVFEKAPEEVTVSLDHFVESGFGAHPKWWGFVAEIADPLHKTATVVGFALYYIRYSTWKGQRLYLEDILVTEAWRGKGIGQQLFDQLLQETKDKNLHGMVWQVLDWNEAAIRFYHRNGAKMDPSWLNASLD
ncbi:MAG: GNAT family N-acetyltransferase [Sphingobacteriia bacterium]|nr:MAG: GNAT family N-acetyltransferase [Sphingobacteriia bacterium]